MHFSFWKLIFLFPPYNTDSVFSEPLVERPPYLLGHQASYKWALSFLMTPTLSARETVGPTGLSFVNGTDKRVSHK